jgi:competence protein ComEA
MDETEIWWHRPQLLLALACVVLGVVMLVGGSALRTMLAPSNPPPADEMGLSLFDEPLEVSENAPTTEVAPPAAAELIVYVSGAVAMPDVYRMPEGARALDAVLAAGGLRSDADGEAVNLAAPLSDAQHLHIPRVGEASPPLSIAADTATAEDTNTNRPIDLNRANADDLIELPGIGTAIAGRIIAYRETQGAFTSIEDLQNVTGIGEVLFAKISPLVTVGP